MNKKDIIIQIYFSNIIGCDLMKQFIEFIKNKCKYLFNSQPNMLSYGYENNGRIINKNVKYSILNEKKLYENLKKTNLNSFELSLLSKDFEFKSSDTDISLHYSPKNEYVNNSSLMLQISCDEVKNKMKTSDVQMIVEELLLMLNERNNKIIYGFVYSMPRIKQPKFYAAGIGSEHLTEQEKKLVHIWGNKKNKCNKQVWDVFWCNILNSSHFASPNIINDIKSILGSKYFKRNKNNIYICTIPTDIVNSNNSMNEFIKYRNELRNVFKKYDLLIS
jgi:hypothetical protein